MIRAPRSIGLAMVVLALASGAREARGDDDSRKRLETMPREERVRLSSVLERFDLLDSDAKAAVTRLDTAIASLDPAVQARYRSILRRYHAWVEGLAEPRRKALDAAPSTSEKLALIARWKKEEDAAGRAAPGHLILGIPTAELGTIPPFEMANAIRYWQTLDEPRRRQLENLPLMARLDGLRRGAVGTPYAWNKHRLPLVEEKRLIDRLRADPEVRRVFAAAIDRIDATARADTDESIDPAPADKNSAPTPAAAKKGEPASDLRKRGNGLAVTNPLHQLAEALYFLEHPVAPTTPENLARFEALIPEWLRKTIDPLPPLVARRRLAVVYRLVYPAPEEVPPPRPAASDPAKARPAPPPRPPGQSEVPL